MIGYVFLAGAIVCEVFATTMLKFANGFTELLPSIACGLGYVLCFFLLGKSLESLNLSLSYALWAGLGIILTTIVAVLFFGEHMSAPLIVGIALIVIGVIVVNMFSSSHG